MLETTKQKLIHNTPYLIKFLELAPEERDWLSNILGRAEITAIQVVLACQNCELTYQEIAEQVGIHHNTAKQIIYALAEGGMDINYSSSNACFYSTGRTRKLVKSQITSEAK